MKVPGLRSLYSRIAITFFVLIFALVSGQYLLLKAFWDQAVEQKNQRIGWELAEAFANELQDEILSGDLDAISQATNRLESFNPSVEIYLLNAQGYTVFRRPAPAGFDTPVLWVPLQPIEQFLSLSFDRSIPLYGGEPRFLGRTTIFSVAPIRLPDGPGYLYVSLNSRVSKNYDTGLETYYLIVGGILTSGGLFFVCSLAGALLFYFITRRFRQLTSTVHLIAQGKLDERIEAPGDDEIGQLGNEINGMADTIVDSLRRAQKTDELRRELVANVSHDIGGPLGALKGHLELLDHEREKLSEKGQSHLDTLGRSINAVLRLSAELLELSKLEAHDIQPERVPFNLLDSITEEVLPRCKSLAREAGITLRAEYSETLPPAIGDPALIDRVLQNLVENAVRYNRPGGEVIVSVAEQDGRIKISVKDSGCGISAEDLPNIFNRFYRGSQQGQARKPGSGLGLAIVEQVLKLHGEAISVQSSVNVGTEFSFALPSAKP